VHMAFYLLLLRFL